ncbi:MAG: 3-phosphoshikimate 1-carboxyvinyltransferase [Bacteroidota bacterium]
MKAVIERGNISGIIKAPASKSVTQRAYAAALLHSGTTVISNTGTSNDELAVLRIIQQLGAEVTTSTAGLSIQSNGVQPITKTIDCGESGLAARLFTPIAALSDSKIIVTGTGSLLKRKMKGISEVLPILGVNIIGSRDHLPLTLLGPMRARSIALDASGGSQLLSGLLFALSSCATEPVIVKVNNLKSQPYIDLTLDVLAHFGKEIAHNSYKEFYINPAKFQQKDRITIDIEGDWSGAAFFLVAGAIAGSVTVNNLDVNSRQADKIILDVLIAAGAMVAIGENSVTVSQRPLQEFEFDATHCPDLFPPLSILAAFCEGESKIKGVHRLFDKESNRVESITEMLYDYGVHFSVEEDTLFITGDEKVQGTVIDTYNDHRIAMAAAIGALRAKGPVEILDAEVVNKSYPNFFEHLVSCGANCSHIE